MPFALKSGILCETKHIYVISWAIYSTLSNDMNFYTPEVHLAQYHLVQKDHLAQHFFEQNFITLKYT